MLYTSNGAIRLTYTILDYNWQMEIKTFDDAYHALGEQHPYVKSYLSFYDWGKGEEDQVMLAFLKLRIIVAALNEGWEPSINEKRYYPCFYVIIEQMQDRVRFMYAYCNHSVSVCDDTTCVQFPSCLCLKNEELSSYCGKQFVGLWATYILNSRLK